MLTEECDIRHSCQNKEKRCLFCDGNSQYKEEKYVNYNSLKKTPSKKKHGMGTEEVARKNYNKYIAQRQPLSGGIEGFEGDIKTVRTLIECKEEEFEVGGTKQITIKKEWHDQIESEAKKHSKLPFLVYAFKPKNQFEPDFDDLYFSTRYQYLLAMLHEMKYMDEQIEALKKENKKLRKEQKSGSK